LNRTIPTLGLLLFLAGLAPARAGDVIGSVRGANGRPLQDVVVFVKGVRAGTPPRQARVLDQKHRTFIPHIMVVQLGTTVLFPNHDTVFHNVFSYREAKRFDLGLYPVGAVRRVLFDEPGLVRIFCNIHSNMSAYIWVVENPYFDQTGRDGAFRLQNVPPGTYTVVFWHPKAGELTRQIRVGAGETRQDERLGE
jgi:plastocyanin